MPEKSTPPVIFQQGGQYLNAMNALAVVISIAIASLAGPFIARLQRRPLVWVTLALVNLIIISVYIVVRNTWHPELRSPAG